jgi:hypothetical protein
MTTSFSIVPMSDQVKIERAERDEGIKIHPLCKDSEKSLYAAKSCKVELKKTNGSSSGENEK